MGLDGRKFALGAALLALPSCGLFAPQRGAHGVTPPSAPAAAAAASELDGVTQSTPLDGVTQSTPLEQLLASNPLRADVPLAGPNGGSISGTVELDPIGAARSAAAIDGSRDVQGSAVYLETPAGYLYVQDGAPLVTPADDQGHFSFGSAELPEGTPVIAGALLISRGVLETCALVQAGPNQISIDAATTFFGRYLQHQAQLRARPITDFDPTTWPSLIDLTSQAMASGCLQFQPGDLAPMQAEVARDEYDAALQCDPALAQAWNSLLGPAPVTPTLPPPGPLLAGQWSVLKN